MGTEEVVGEKPDKIEYVFPTTSSVPLVPVVPLCLV
jgi:hypothetical protein